MSEEQSCQGTIQKETDATITSLSDPSTATQTNSVHCKQRIFPNYMVGCLHTNVDESSNHVSNIRIELKDVVKNVRTFRDTEQCVASLTDLKGIETFLIIIGDHWEKMIQRIHDIDHIKYIYILSNSSSQYEPDNKNWPKIKGVYTQVMSICSALKQTIDQCNQKSISMSFICKDDDSSNQNAEKLDPSYMYTQLFKEIILDVDYDKSAVKEFATFLRNESGANYHDICEFEREYRPESAIEWYKRKSFLYEKVNQALRTLEAEMIIKMGFFICDLHRQIRDLHTQQISGNQKTKYRLFRGQGISELDFQKLKKAKGGLLSFNSFLSTSKNEEVGLTWAESNNQSSHMIGILFEITVGSSGSSVPFADIEHIGVFNDEQEILFSMHAVFRIVAIVKTASNDGLDKVILKLTNGDDKDLRHLADRLRLETPGPTAWERLGRLLNKIDQFPEAEKLYRALLETTHDDSKKALYYNQLGLVKYYQHDYKDSIYFYEKFREMLLQVFAAELSLFGTYFNNIGMTYDKMGQYSKALSFHKKSLRVRKATLPEDHSDLATFYNNMGLAYDKLQEYPKALSCFESSLEIKRKTLPLNHPDFAQTHNNIGMVYYNMKDYTTALVYYQDALRIKTDNLPKNHRSLAIAYNNIGLVFDKLGNYEQALLFYEKDLEISEKTLCPKHCDLAYTYNNIAGVHYKREEYQEALSYFERAYKIFQSSLCPTHPELQIVQQSIELVKQKLPINSNE